MTKIIVLATISCLIAGCCTTINQQTVFENSRPIDLLDWRLSLKYTTYEPIESPQITVATVSIDGRAAGSIVYERGETGSKTWSYPGGLNEGQHVIKITALVGKNVDVGPAIGRKGSVFNTIAELHFPNISGPYSKQPSCYTSGQDRVEYSAQFIVNIVK